MSSTTTIIKHTEPFSTNTLLKNTGVFLGLVGLFALLIFSLPIHFSWAAGNTPFNISFSLLTAGVLLYTLGMYKGKSDGIKNNHVWFSSLSSKGLYAWLLGLLLTAFYVLMYWYPQLLGAGEEANSGFIKIFDPLAMKLTGKKASRWFPYGVLYAWAVLVFGIKFIIKYWGNRYQVIRTLSVIFFQLGFAFLIPNFLEKMGKPSFDFKDMWPLKYHAVADWSLNGLISNGTIGWIMLLSGIAMVLIVSPILTYFYGKRWYCSWVCGCGGLAETAGDPFRQLSDSSIRAWKIERWSIHIVLALVIIMSIASVYNYLHNFDPEKMQIQIWLSPGSFIAILTVLFSVICFFFYKNKTAILDKHNRLAFSISIVLLLFIIGALLFNYFVTGSGQLFPINSYKIQEWYGFFIGAIFSGIVGVGFYPLLGSRVWCRFGCPMAAILGIQQKFFSRFRITTNGSQCISCGNCTTYCEMGIDVRAYAEKGQDIVRASCVGCGICSAVCPRGVLRLENGPNTISKAQDQRNIFIPESDIGILS